MNEEKGCNVEKSSGQIEKEMHILDKIIGDLSINTDELGKRIHNILLPGVPTEQGDEKEIEPPIVPLASELGEFRKRIIEISNRLTDYFNRVEL